MAEQHHTESKVTPIWRPESYIALTERLYDIEAMANILQVAAQAEGDDVQPRHLEQYASKMKREVFAAMGEAAAAIEAAVANK